MPDHVDRQLEFRHGLHHAEHGGRAAHVVLHFVHGSAGLDRDAAGIEGDALADEYHGLCVWRVRPRYCRTMKRGGSFGALSDSQERTHAQLAEAAGARRAGQASVFLLVFAMAWARFTR